MKFHRNFPSNHCDSWPRPQVLQALLQRAEHVEELPWPAASPGLPAELAQARRRILALKLDVLVYLERLGW